MLSRNDFLSPDEISQIAPRRIIELAIKGVMKEYGLSISVMLDIDEDDPELSGGTDKVFITDKGDYEPHCAFLRNHPDERVNIKCPKSDRDHFERAKREVAKDPNYSGEIYTCRGGLQDFVVPIIERANNTFIGVIFGGQKRPKEFKSAARRRLRDFIFKQQNRDLQLVPFRRLYRLFLKVDQVAEGQLEEMMETCQSIAREISDTFRFFSEQKRTEMGLKLETNCVGIIESALLQAGSEEELWLSMPIILGAMKDWLCFDWGIVLKREGSQDGKEIFRAIETIGHGFRHTPELKKELLEFSSEELERKTEVIALPQSAAGNIESFAPRNSTMWAIALARGEYGVSAILICGSVQEGSGRHEELERMVDFKSLFRLSKISALIASRRGELRALEGERKRRAELEEVERKQAETIDTLNNTLLSLTHWLNRPLIGANGILTTIRDKHRELGPERLEEAIAWAIIAIDHTALVCRGISRIFAVEGGREKFKIRREKIDAKIELQKLCSTMRIAFDESDISFNFFEFRESPDIEMDRDSFLYVFYTLIDNAIKYSDFGKEILLGCDMEGGRYTLKVKSYGEPILPVEKEKVFERFWRGRNAARGDEVGLGIGCWAAREHMRHNDGDLRLEVSSRLSIFIVYPPM